MPNPKLESKVEKLSADVDKIASQMRSRIGAIKADANEFSTHPKVVNRLGEYAEICHLKSGDYAFDTTWGKVARIEYKLFDNLIEDISNAHLNDQLRKQEEDGGISILLLEGYITCTTSGFIKTSRREYKGRTWWWLWNYLTSAQAAGTYLYFSPNDLQTPRIIIALYEYCNKPEHDALGRRQKLLSLHPSVTPHQRTYTSIPGVSDEIAKALDVKFGSVYGLCRAEKEDIIAVLGNTPAMKKRAEFIYKYVRNQV